MTQTHILEIDNADILKEVEARTFKFGKARDNGEAPKLINGVKLTDLGYDRMIALGWIDDAISNIRVAFVKYAGEITTAGTGETKKTRVEFILPSVWDSGNAMGFDADCREYIVNIVISDFLGLSLPREAQVYAEKASLAYKRAERKLYYKKSL
jgi:hypothetical protein